MRPEELQKLALERHKRNADEWYSYVLKNIKDRAEDGFFDWENSEFDEDNSFSAFGECNKKELDRVLKQLKDLGLKTKIDGDIFEISWKK